MPGFDRTGPNGEGPLTGRGLGPCGRGLARGGGVGRGLGRGLRFRTAMQPQTITEKEEKEILQEELKDLKAEQTEIEKRLKELKA